VTPRTGLFGGTFDPIHVGHLDVARAARRALHLDRVVFVPSHVPPHRSPPKASAAHRFAMVAFAVAGEAGFEVSDMEMTSPDPSYTVATLDRLAARGVDTTRLFFVTGADAFADVGAWKGFPQLLDRCHFAVVSRPERPAPALRTSLAGISSRMVDIPLPGEIDGTGPIADRPCIFLIDAPTAPVSSTEIRKRVADGASIASIAGLVPDAVAAHITRHRLYLETRESHEPV
jgi:nicotinate-nucleotide adenylyltransferase